jgi:hypothetical protein
VHADIDRMSLAEADVLEYYMKYIPGVKHVKVYDRTCDAVISYTCERSAIAREIADITIEAEDLRELLVLRDISKALMSRIDSDYRVIITLNSLLILLGAFGIITPAASAMMHNLSTIGISLYNMTDLIDA